jgi:hypothetical protein
LELGQREKVQHLARAVGATPGGLADRFRVVGAHCHRCVRVQLPAQVRQLVLAVALDDVMAARARRAGGATAGR